MPSRRRRERDFNSAATHSSTALELYTAMLERYPQRANPGALWVT